MEHPTYAELGKVVGIPRQGPWRTVLDQIAKEELAAGRPDITFLVTNKETGHPSRMKFKTKSKPDEEQKKYAVERMQEIIKEYNPGTENPFVVKLGW